MLNLPRSRTLLRMYSSASPRISSSRYGRYTLCSNVVSINPRFVYAPATRAPAIGCQPWIKTPGRGGIDVRPWLPSLPGKSDKGDFKATSAKEGPRGTTRRRGPWNTADASIANTLNILVGGSKACGRGAGDVSYSAPCLPALSFVRLLATQKWYEGLVPNIEFHFDNHWLVLILHCFAVRFRCSNVMMEVFSWHILMNGSSGVTPYDVSVII